MPKWALVTDSLMVYFNFINLTNNLAWWIFLLTLRTWKCNCELFKNILLFILLRQWTVNIELVGSKYSLLQIWLQIYVVLRKECRVKRNLKESENNFLWWCFTQVRMALFLLRLFEEEHFKNKQFFYFFTLSLTHYFKLFNKKI